jgi:GDP-D-mannose dehydratase
MRALIIGIRGQDGTFLKKILVRNEYSVFGVLRPVAHMGLNWENDVIQSMTKKQQDRDIEIDLAKNNNKVEEILQ